MNGENAGHFPIGTPTCGGRNTKNVGLRAARWAELRETQGAELHPENSGSCFKQLFGKVTLGEW